MPDASSSFFEFAAVLVSWSTVAFQFLRTRLLRHDAETATCRCD